MAMKIYRLPNGREAWFHPGDEPEGAEEIKPKRKARTVENKSRETETK